MWWYHDKSDGGGGCGVFFVHNGSAIKLADAWL
jgi:hypothetical protein